MSESRAVLISSKHLFIRLYNEDLGLDKSLQFYHGLYLTFFTHKNLLEKWLYFLDIYDTHERLLSFTKNSLVTY